MNRSYLVLLVVSALGCGGPHDRPTTITPEPRVDDVAPESPPLAQLPSDVTPTHYTLSLTIDPNQPTFSGTVQIAVRLDSPRDVIWLHGKDLTVSEASIAMNGAAPVAAQYEQVHEDGVAALRLLPAQFERFFSNGTAIGGMLPQTIESGDALITITYTAPFNEQLEGLYHVEAEDQHYAFTQFEPLAARTAFPGFDEPRFKLPFDISLTVRDEHVAAGNTPIVEETDLEGDLRRVRFETTRPMPTYLVAWAVGNLDIVEAPPIPANAVRGRELPFRGIAVHGQGPRLAHALEQTPAVLAALEDYFGIEYPYAKLDIVAVPDFGAGAMENIGLVTFRDYFLLLDENAPESQRRSFGYIMAHELAHMWAGNLVTMPWWDDLWLNEAVASWMETKAVAVVFPEFHPELATLEDARWAMYEDSLVSARQIRQPIESTHDIHNAFDSITYSKGSAVLSMFERYLGVDTFREGMRRYMREQSWGTATYTDFLSAMSAASGQDVATPFQTFLLQPGIPYLDVALLCDAEGPRLSVSQSRYLPVGSTGGRTAEWDVPVCVRYPVGEEIHQTCSLVTERNATIALEASECPAWVMPNADGSGYFRFSLPTDGFGRLTTDAWSHLSIRERMSVADNMSGAFKIGAMDATFYQALRTFVLDEERRVVEACSEPLGFARSHLVSDDLRPAVEAYVRELYQPRHRVLGFAPRRGAEEDGETGLLRAHVVSTLATLGQEPRVRRELARQAQRYVGFPGNGAIREEGINPNLIGTALVVAIQDGDARFFDHVVELLFRTTDGRIRTQLIDAIASTRNTTLAARALELGFDERIRTNEITRFLRSQLGMRETRDATWQWLQANFDRYQARISADRVGDLPLFLTGLCSEAGATEVDTFFRDRIRDLPGGPRNLASALESLRLCAAQVEAHRETAARFFTAPL